MHGWRRYASIAVVLAALVAAGCGGAGQAPREASFRYATSGLIPVSFSPGATTNALASFASAALAVDVGRGLPRGTSAVAWSLNRPVSVYGAPGDAAPKERLPVHDQFGITQVFLVARSQPGWLEVYLPTRPNNSTGWIRSSAVQLTLDPYRVVVDTAKHELSTLEAGRVLMRTMVGIGKAATPTPHGLFYIVEALRMVPPTGPYGTYAFGLSAHSNVLTSFGTGDAQIAIHGTNEPASIGQNWSNGCIHMSDSAANWMARRVPLGTPVQVY